MSPRGDETLRRLERAVEASGDTSSRLKLAAELGRRDRGDEALALLMESGKLFPLDADVRREIGKFRGPAPGPWSAIKGDARNTRRSPARGPRGEGTVKSRELLAPFDGVRPDPTPPPLLGVGFARPCISLGSRTILALTADGHVISHGFGAGGFELCAERGGQRAWNHFFPHQPATDDKSFSRAAHLALAPDGTVFALIRSGKLVCVEPWGEKRWEIDTPSRVESLALDADRARLYIAYEMPPRLAALDPRTGAVLAETDFPQIGVVQDAVVLDDGRVACVSPFKAVAVVSESGALEQTFNFTERIFGAFAAAGPKGELVVVTSDSKGARVESFEAATGKKWGSFEVSECVGVPSLDAEGTVYLDGGSRGFVLGFDLISGVQRYKLDRKGSLWDRPQRPGSSIAIGDGEVVFVDFAPGEVAVVRGGGA